MNVLGAYQTLNISPLADWKQVKQSYYNLAKRYHPDVNYGDPFFESKFRRISQAYQVLGRQFKRRQAIKNMWLKKRKQNRRARERYPHMDTIVIPPKKAKRDEGLVPIWKKKIEEIVFKYENKWAPLTVWQGVTVNSSQAAKGGAVRIHTVHSSFQVKIPAGITDQTQLRVRGKGEKSFFYDKRGDLYLNIRVIPADKPDSGNVNLFYEKEVSKEDIEENKVLALNTFQGLIKFFVPKDTHDGKSYILKAKKNSSGFDFEVNHIVKIRIA